MSKKTGSNYKETIEYVLNQMPEIFEDITGNLLEEGDSSDNLVNKITTKLQDKDKDYKVNYYSSDDPKWNPPSRGNLGVDAYTSGSDISIKDKGVGGADFMSEILMHELTHFGDAADFGHSYHYGNARGFKGDKRNIANFEDGTWLGPDPRMGASAWTKAYNKFHNDSRKGTENEGILAGFEGKKWDLNKYSYDKEMKKIIGGFPETLTDDNYDEFNDRKKEVTDSLWNVLGKAEYGENYKFNELPQYGDSQRHYEQNMKYLMEEIENKNLMDTLNSIYYNAKDAE